MESFDLDKLLKLTEKYEIDKNKSSNKDSELESKDYYKKVISILEKLWEDGIIQRSGGYCLSVSDMVQKLLKFNGIESRLLECNLIFLDKDPPNMRLVGYDGIKEVQDDKMELDTHVVCVTETEIPILIDLSINYLSNSVRYICQRYEPNDTNNIEYKIGSTTWIYQEKVNSRVPSLHRKSISDRIKLDLQVENNFKRINYFLIGLSLISVLNFIRGGIDYYQKYINTTNGFGPHKIVDK